MVINLMAEAQMPLQDQKFLASKTKQGMSQSEALQKLQKVKAAMKQPAFSQQMPGAQQMAGAAGLPQQIEKAQAGTLGWFGEKGKDLATGLWSRTAGGVADYAKMGAGTAFAAVRANTLGLLQAAPFVLKGDFQKAGEIYESSLAAPVNLGGENINMLVQDPETGQINVGESISRASGETLQGLGSTLNTAMILSGGATTMATKFLPNLIAGASYEAGEGIERKDSAPAIILEALVGGLLQGGIAATIGYANAKAAAAKEAKTFKNALMRRGVTEEAASGIVGAKPAYQKMFKDYIGFGLDKLDDPINAPDVFQAVSKNTGLDDFITTGWKQVDDLVRTNYDDAVKQLGNSTSSGKMVLNTIDDLVDDGAGGGIKIWGKNPYTSLKTKQGVPYKQINFKNTNLRDMPRAGQDLVNQVYKEVQVGKNAIQNKAFESFKRSINKQVKATLDPTKNDTIFSSFLKQVKRPINQTLNNASPLYQKANMQWAKWSNAKDALGALMETKVKGVGFIAQGDKFLRGLTGANQGRYKEVLNVMDDVAREFGVKAPKDLTTKAWFASLAEQMTKSPAGLPLKQGVAEVGKKVADRGFLGGVAKDAVNLYQGGKNVLGIGAPPTPIATGATQMISMLNKQLAQSGGKQTAITMSKNMINQLVQFLMKLEQYGHGITGGAGVEVASPILDPERINQSEPDNVPYYGASEQTSPPNYGQ